MKNLILYIFFLCMTIEAHSQAKALNLQQCIDMALTKSYHMQVAAKGVEKAKNLIGTAWNVDKTEISLSQDPSSGGSTDNALSVSQSIEFPTVYIARRAQLKAESQAEVSKTEVIKANLVYQVKSTYYQMVYETECFRILSKQDSILSKYRTVTETRYKAGDTRKLEYFTAERMYKENKMEMTAMLSKMENTKLQLSTLLNSEMPIVPAEQILVPIDFVQKSFNYSLTPEGELARNNIVVANKAVATAKSEYAPSLSLALRNQFVISSWNPYHVDRSRFQEGNFLGFEVGVSFPLFYGATKAKVKAAKKDREIAELVMRQEEKDRLREYLAALSKSNSSHVRLTYYQEEGKDRSIQLEKLSHIEYENGEISYLEYINALKDCIDFHMKRVRAINDYNQSVITLERLMGK